LSALKALPSRRNAGVFPDQPVTLQNAMDGVARQLQPGLPKQYLLLARSPVRVAQAQPYHTLFQFTVRAPRTVLRLAALLSDPRHPQLQVAAQPQISRGTGNLTGRTQRSETPAGLRCLDHKPHPLFLNVHRLPCHPAYTSAPERGV
jgi:hypothetical protein